MPPTAPSRPANAIETGRAEITVKSSFYQLEEGIPTCNVVLAISFDLAKDMRLAHAVVPLDLKVYGILPAAISTTPQLKAIDAECFIHRYYTSDIEETIIMDRYERHEVTTIMPNVELGVPKYLLTKLSNLGKTKDRTKSVEKGITLIGQCLKNNMQVKWIFCNESKRSYPRNIKLMIIVKQTNKSSNPYFPFSLELGKEFSVSVFGGTFNNKVGEWKLRKSRPLPIHITGDWETKIAQNALIDVEKFDKVTPQYIGLRAAGRMAMVNPKPLNDAGGNVTNSHSVVPQCVSDYFSVHFLGCLLASVLLLLISTLSYFQYRTGDRYSSSVHEA